MVGISSEFLYLFLLFLGMSQLRVTGILIINRRAILVVRFACSVSFAMTKILDRLQVGQDHSWIGSLRRRITIINLVTTCVMYLAYSFLPSYVLNRDVVNVDVVVYNIWRSSWRLENLDRPCCSICVNILKSVLTTRSRSLRSIVMVISQVYLVHKTERRCFSTLFSYLTNKLRTMLLGIGSTMINFRIILLVIIILWLLVASIVNIRLFKISILFLQVFFLFLEEVGVFIGYWETNLVHFLD